MRSPRALAWPLCLSVIAACGIGERVVDEAAPASNGNLGGAGAKSQVEGGVAGLASIGVGGSNQQVPPSKGGFGGSAPSGCKDEDGFFSGGAFDGAVTGSGGDECGDPSVGCTWDAPFVSSRPLVELNQTDEDYGAELFDDERRIYFVSLRSPSVGLELWTASRSDRFHAFGEASSLHVLRPINSGEFALSRDEVTIYLYNGQVQTAARKSLDEPFGVAEPLVLPQSLPPYALPHESDSGRFYVAERSSSTAGVYQLAELGALAVPTLVLEAPKSLEPPKSDVYSPVVSHDELTLYFALTTPQKGPCVTGLFSQIWVATRASVTEAFTHRGVVPSLSSRYDAEPNALSKDGCRLYYSRPTKRGDFNLYVAEKAKPGCPAP